MTCTIHVYVLLTMLYTWSLSLLSMLAGLEGQAEEDEEDGEESTDDEGESMCPSGQHKWSDVRCMICRFCGFCTGYGPTCCNEGVAGREPGM